MAKRIVIVGAGYAGIEAALKLNKLGRKDGIEVTLIDRNPYHTLLTEIHEVAGNRVDEDSVCIPLSTIFKDTRVKVVCDDITTFDFEGKRISSAKQDYPFDYLVLGMGSAPNFYGIKGLAEHALTLWSLEDAIRIREHIKDCFVKAHLERDARERSRLLNFVVGGAGFTGVEMAGELAIWVKALCKEHGIARSEVRIMIVDVLPRVLSTLDEKSSLKATKILEKKLGVEVKLDTKIVELTQDHVDLGDEQVDTRTLIWAAGVRSCQQVDGLGLDTQSACRISVDAYCRTLKYPYVYAIGDIGGLLSGSGKPYPAMVETALYTGHGAAENILADLHGKEPHPIKVKLHGVMVCISCYYAVANLMGVRPPNFASKYMKFFVNAHYLHGIAGWKSVWHYFREELLARKQPKKLLEKHYTKTMQAWWAVPLRLFVGYTWFFEGLKKIQEGWLKTPHLKEFFNTAVQSGGDAASGASQAAETVVKTHYFINWDILGIFKILIENTAGKPKVFRIDFPLVTSIVKNWVLLDGWNMFFQIAITLAEVLVGLAIFSGTLTFLSGLVSLGLIAMFVTSTGMYDTQWWLPFATLLVMGGAGRAFGVDHYALPYFARVLDSSKKNGILRIFFFK